MDFSDYFNDLSQRSKNLLDSLGIKNETDLIDYYDKNKNFLKEKNSGKKTNKELLGLCHRVIDSQIDKDIDKDISILRASIEDHGLDLSGFKGSISKEKTLEDLSLSVRANNVLSSNNISTINEMVIYYQENDTFNNLQKAGRKVDDELIPICNEYLNGSGMREVVEIYFSDINDEKIKDYNYLLRAFIQSELSKRSYIIIDSIFEDNINFIPSVYSLFFKLDLQGITNIFGNDRIERIKNALNLFYNNYLKNGLRSSLIVKEEILKLTFISLFNFENNNDFWDLHHKDFINDNKINYFKLIDYIVRYSNIIPKEDDKDIYLKRSDYYFHKKMESLESIGQKLGVTRERARQKLEKLKNNNFEARFIKAAINWSSSVLFIDKESIPIHFIIDEEFVHQHNEKYGCNFNHNFYTEYYTTLLDDNYSCLTFDKGVLFISLNYIEGFEVDSFLNDIYKDYQREAVKIENLNINKLIDDYYTVDNNLHYNDKYDELSQVNNKCSEILRNYFNAIIYDNGELNYLKGRLKVHEYAYLVLDGKSEPMHVEDIAKEIKELAPETSFPIDSIRNSMVREKEIFYSFSRTSSYGLREWERYDDSTIRDLIEKILENYSRPLSLKELVKIVNKYPGRNTTDQNINGSIIVDESGRFERFSLGFIGLKNKSYSLDLHKGRITPKIVSYINDYVGRHEDGISRQELVGHFNNKYNINEDMLNIIIDSECELEKLKCKNGIVYSFYSFCDTVSEDLSGHNNKQQIDSLKCKLVNQLSKLRESDMEAVADGESGSLSTFKNYMHIERATEKELIRLLESAQHKTSALILLCGNVGYGKSHLISKLQQDRKELCRGVDFINDATESNHTDKSYIQTLKERLQSFNTTNLGKKNQKIVLAINLGTLANFIESEGIISEFKQLADYIYKSKILDDCITQKVLKVIISAALILLIIIVFVSVKIVSNPLLSETYLIKFLMKAKKTLLTLHLMKNVYHVAIPALLEIILKY